MKVEGKGYSEMMVPTAKVLKKLKIVALKCSIHCINKKYYVY